MKKLKPTKVKSRNTIKYDLLSGLKFLIKGFSTFRGNAKIRALEKSYVIGNDHSTTVHFTIL